MIDSHLPTPLPLSLSHPEPAFEPEPGSMIILSDPYPFNHHIDQGSLNFDIDYDFETTSLPVDTSETVDQTSPDLAFGLGPGPRPGLGAQLGSGSAFACGLGIEESFNQFPPVQYEFVHQNDKDLIPTLTDTDTIVDYNISTLQFQQTQFDHSSLINQFSIPNAYSPITQFAQAEYTLPANSYLDLELAPAPAPLGFSNTYETRPSNLQLDQLVLSPTGLWSPVTSTSQLPTHELDYQYEPQPRSQLLSQGQGPPIPQYYQDHTPTLAPHCPDYDLELYHDLNLNLGLELEMTRDLSLPYPSSIFHRPNQHQGYRETRTRTITPIDTTDHRPLVTCRPTINFQLPSALGDQVHNLETFGLKAEPVLEQLPTPITTTSSIGIGTRFWKSDLAKGSVVSQYQTRLAHWNDSSSGQAEVEVEVVGGGGGRYDLSPVIAQRPGNGMGIVNGHGNGTGIGVGNGIDCSSGSGYPPTDMGLNYDHQYQVQDRNDRNLINNNPPTYHVGNNHQYVQGQIKKIHPRPMPTYNHNHVHRAPSLNLIQPPPHTYNPIGLYPSPVTTSSSNSSVFYHSNPNSNPNSNSNPKLPGVNQLFDNYSLPLSNSIPLSQNEHEHGHGHGHGHGYGYGHTLSAPPSTIFPNHRSQDRYPHQNASYTQTTHFHPPPFPDQAKSVSTSHHPYDHDRDIEMLERRGMRLSQSPSQSQSPSLISVDQSQDQDQDQEMDLNMDMDTNMEMDMNVSRRSSISATFASEEEEEEEGEGDEEVLSEYKPKYSRKAKSKTKGKGKGNYKDKGGNTITIMSKTKNPPRKVKNLPNPQVERLDNLITNINDNGNGNGNGYDNGNGNGDDNGTIPLVMEGPNMGHHAKLPKSRGNINAAYSFIYEDGVAYTDDAELKQTRELRRRCFNCGMKTPPSWRKSILTLGKILCNKCGIYERTHIKPRPQQQDNEKLRRNPTPPPSLGGYEPLVYEEEGECEGEDSPIMGNEIPLIQPSPSPISNSSPFWQKVFRKDERNRTPLKINTPPSAVVSPQSPQVQSSTRLIALNQHESLPPLTPIVPSQTQTRIQIQDQPDVQPIAHSQPYLNLNPTLNTDSRQLPPLRTVTPYWSTATPQSTSEVPSPIGPTPTGGHGNGDENNDSIGMKNGNGNGNGTRGGWTGRAGLTPYSRPGSRGSDLKNISNTNTSLRGVSGKW